ncbi:MAG: hypothetical protein ACPG8W_13365, partial [Candidatus Promineifilaceae bacterium]
SEVTIRELNGKKQIAKVGLNGYKSFSKDPTQCNGVTRLIWSFTVLDGNRQSLTKSWSHHEPILLCTPNGKSVPVRVVAMPVDDKGFGLIEFL